MSTLTDRFNELKLFQPLTVGNITVQQRIVMSPMTRLRANAQHVQSELAVKYYSQRASAPGTLLISEAVFIAAKAGGIPYVPGIWSDEQIAAWKKVTDAVHEKGSFIFAQLWALGRTANPAQLASEDPSFPYVSSGNIPLPGHTAELPPRPLTVDEIKEYVRLYATAARNAIQRAGFDGVEIHSTSGYLPDQFLQDVSNNRTDQYGGSIENRSRFVLEIVDAVVKEVGEKAVGIRFGPWSTFQGMRMKDPIPTFAHIITAIRDRRTTRAGMFDIETPEGETNEPFWEIWKPRPYLTAGGYTRENAIQATQEKDNLLAGFGRHFTSNPDLVLRLKKNIPLTHYDRPTFALPLSPDGYADWPFAGEVQEVVA